MIESLVVTLHESVSDDVAEVSLCVENGGSTIVPRGWAYDVFRVLEQAAVLVGTLVGERDLEPGSSKEVTFETNGPGAGYLVAQPEQRIDDVEYVGRLTYESPKKAARARRDAIERGPVAQLIWVHAPDVLDVVGRGPALTPGTEHAAALVLLARRARHGSVSCNMFGREVGLRVEAGSKRWREVVPDRGPADGAATIIEGVRHAAPIHTFEVTPGLIVAAGGCTGYSDRGADVSVWDRDSGELVARLVGLRGHVDTLALSADGSRVAGADKRKVVVWDAPSGQKQGTIRLAGVRTLAVDDERIVLGTKRGAFVAEAPDWEAAAVSAGKELVEVYGASGGFFAVAEEACGFHPRRGAPKPLTMPDARWAPPHAVVTPDGKCLVHTWAESHGPATSVWARNGRRKATLEGWGRVVALDDEHILVAQTVAPHVVWRWKSGEVVHLDVELPTGTLRRISATELVSVEGERLRITRLPSLASLDFVKAVAQPDIRKKKPVPADGTLSEPRDSQNAKAESPSALSQRALVWAAWIRENSESIEAAETRASKSDWTWDLQPDGTHHGAWVDKDVIRWFIQSPNPHSCNGGSQSFDSFMAEGRIERKMDDKMMAEIYVSVRRKIAGE